MSPPPGDERKLIIAEPLIYFVEMVISAVRSLLGRPSLAHSVRKEGLTYLRPDKMKRIEQALRSVAGVPGDFLEFGVALGGSAIVIAAQAEGRHFHGFDVFEMIPPPTSDKDDVKSKERFEVIRSGQASGIAGETYYGYRPDLLGDVKAAFARHGLPVDGRSRFLHKGLFEATWPEVAIERVAFAHLDCDWYDPVRFCLEAVADRLSPGGLLVIDDYHAYGGCRTAVDEFLGERADFAFENGPNPILRKN